MCAASLRPIRQDAPVVDLSDDLARWFGEIELLVEPGAPITALLGELVTMLDALGPTRVDRASSSVHQERVAPSSWCSHMMPTRTAD